MSELREILESEARLKHNGVIRRADAVSAGMPVSQIDRRVRRRQWVPAGHPGWMILPEFWDDPVAHLRCASGATRGPAWRRSAMALRGLGAHPPLPEVLALRQSRSHSSNLARYDPSVWAATYVDGLLCLTLEHTVASMAGIWGRDRFDELVDRVILEERTSWPELMAVFNQVRRQGRRGSALLAQVLEERSGEPRVPLSIWTRKFARAMEDAGFPKPEFEWRVIHYGRLVAQVDLAYPHLRYAVELDSVSHHLNTDAFEEDRRRDAELASVGWLVRRFTWKQFDERFNWVVHILRSDLSTRTL